MTRTCLSVGSFMLRWAATADLARARVRKVLGSRTSSPVSPERETAFLVLGSLWLCGGVPGGSTCGRASSCFLCCAAIRVCRLPRRWSWRWSWAYDGIATAPATTAPATSTAQTSLRPAFPVSSRMG